MQWRVLQNRNFRNLWLGQLISQLGDSFYFLLFGFMVDHLTKDTRIVSLVMLVQGLPYIVLSPYAGVIADRLDRRRILIFCDVASTVVLLIAAAKQLLSGLTVPEIFVVAALLSVVNAFFIPAKNASISRLVPEDQVNEANSLSLATQNTMPLLGLLGSTMVLTALAKLGLGFGFGIAIIINAASFLASALFIARLPALPTAGTSGSGSAKEEFREGWHYVRSHRVLLTIVALSCGTTLMIGSFYPTYLAANRQWFGGEFVTLAIVEASFFVFMILASLYLGRHPVRRLGLAFAVPVVLIGLLVAAMAWGRNYAVFVALNAACGIFVPYLQIPITNYVQLEVPDEVRGRVFGFMGLASMGMTPISLLIFGQLIQVFGLHASFLVSGLGFTAVGLIALALPEFRRAQITVPAPEEQAPIES